MQRHARRRVRSATKKIATGTHHSFDSDFI